MVFYHLHACTLPLISSQASRELACNLSTHSFAAATRSSLSGNVKLTDFGLAHRVKKGKVVRSFSGTDLYLGTSKRVSSFGQTTLIASLTLSHSLACIA